MEIGGGERDATDNSTIGTGLPHMEWQTSAKSRREPTNRQGSDKTMKNADGFHPNRSNMASTSC